MTNMLPFATKTLPTAYDVLAPDGSEVRILQRMNGGSMAHFRLPPGTVAKAVQHRTVEEMWFVVAGRGEMWRAQDGREEVVPLVFGTSLTIPLGTAFQFRAAKTEPLDIVGCTMPPWPGDDEAFVVDGKWEPTV
jgi:mannose-6-phosphate isomerase-like protein (cupin superfamily)